MTAESKPAAGLPEDGLIEAINARVKFLTDLASYTHGVTKSVHLRDLELFKEAAALATRLQGEIVASEAERKRVSDRLIEFGHIALQLEQRAEQAERRVRQAQTTPLFPADDGDKEHTVKFLQMIMQAGPKGVTADDLMKVLDVRAPKGMGGRMTRINSVLAKYGFESASVYQNNRTAEGRFWLPGRQAIAALNALRLT